MNDIALWIIILSPVVIVPGYHFVRKWFIERGPCLHLKPVAESYVEDHEGPCALTWSGAWSLSRFDGGYTGFFRNVKKLGPFWVSYGPEFHGIVPFGSDGRTVKSTAIKYDYPGMI